MCPVGLEAGKSLLVPKKCQQMRTPGVEPGSQAWEACMMPLHYVRLWLLLRKKSNEWQPSPHRFRHNGGRPGIEPGSQALKACMMPLHYVRLPLLNLLQLKHAKTTHTHKHKRAILQTAGRRQAMPLRNTRPQHKPHKTSWQRNRLLSLFQLKTATLKDIAIAPVTTPSPSRLAEALR